MPRFPVHTRPPPPWARAKSVSAGLSTRNSIGETMPFLERPGQPRLHYELDDYTDPWKNARYIMLQHGYARNSRFWRACVPYLSRFYKIVRPDLRGLGKSDRNFDLERGISVEAYLKDFVALLDHLGI